VPLIDYHRQGHHCKENPLDSGGISGATGTFKTTGNTESSGEKSLLKFPKFNSGDISPDEF
jgi:hypothetical protein